MPSVPFHWLTSHQPPGLSIYSSVVLTNRFLFIFLFMFWPNADRRVKNLYSKKYLYVDLMVCASVRVCVQ